LSRLNLSAQDMRSPVAIIAVHFNGSRRMAQGYQPIFLAPLSQFAPNA
jgi:hypothetical protein